MGVRLALLGLFASLCAFPASAIGHGDGHRSQHGAAMPADRLHGVARRTEERTRAGEAVALGAGHAAEHARDRARERRARARWLAISPRRRHALRRAERAARAAISQEGLEDPPELVGRWTTGPFALPNYAIHAAMLPTGEVAFWGYPPPDENNVKTNSGEAAIWDPAKGTGSDAFAAVPPPLMDPDGPGPQGVVPAPIYCSGLSFQADGSVLVAGGN